MILGDRRQALLVICLAAMQVAWLTPFVFLLCGTVLALAPMPLYGFLLAGLLCWLVALEVLGRLDLPSPRYELAVAGLVLLTTLVGIRLLAYAGRPAADVSWLGHMVRTLFDVSPGIGRLAAVILVNIVLWQSAASTTSRSLGFFAVGFSFRVGMLLLFLGGGLVHLVDGQELVPLLWCYFAFGLLAVAVARIDEKAEHAASSGPLLPPGRLAQLLLAVGVTVGLAAGLAVYYRRDAIMEVLRWLSPVFSLIGDLVVVVLTLLLYLLLPVLMWIERTLRMLLSNVDLSPIIRLFEQLQQFANRPTPEAPPVTGFLPGWAWTGMRYVVVAVVLLILLVFVLLYLEHARRAAGRKQGEMAEGEQMTLGGGILAGAFGRLAELAGLVRRYGVNRQLLAAVSVQNIYANLTRLARLRGYPRRPAQPPDRYLPVLSRAFPGQDEPLARITAAYMRVHYGDRPVELTELAALRSDYHRIRHAR